MKIQLDFATIDKMFEKVGSVFKRFLLEIWSHESKNSEKAKKQNKNTEIKKKWKIENLKK